MIASVDLPAPLIPVSTIEASGSNILTEAKSELSRGELGAEREAIFLLDLKAKHWEGGEVTAIPLAAGELFEVRGEG